MHNSELLYSYQIFGPVVLLSKQQEKVVVLCLCVLGHGACLASVYVCLTTLLFLPPRPPLFCLPAVGAFHSCLFFSSHPPFLYISSSSLFSPTLDESPQSFMLVSLFFSGLYARFYLHHPCHARFTGQFSFSCEPRPFSPPLNSSGQPALTFTHSYI